MHGLAAVHRTGLLAVGDVAVVVAASAAHRGQAFEAARRLIDDLKASVPVWKRQVFDDGDAGVGRHAVRLAGAVRQRVRGAWRVVPTWLMWLLPGAARDPRGDRLVGLVGVPRPPAEVAGLGRGVRPVPGGAVPGATPSPTVAATRRRQPAAA